MVKGIPSNLPDDPKEALKFLVDYYAEVTIEYSKQGPKVRSRAAHENWAAEWRRTADLVVNAMIDARLSELEYPGESF